MDCNDGNVKGFVGYKYPTYACCVAQPRTRLVGTQATACFFEDVGWAFMPTQFQAASGHRTRGQRVPTLRLLYLTEIIFVIIFFKIFSFNIFS